MYRYIHIQVVDCNVQDAAIGPPSGCQGSGPSQWHPESNSVTEGLGNCGLAFAKLNMFYFFVLRFLTEHQ